MNTCPQWICHSCGTKHGYDRGNEKTWHPGACGWCGDTKDERGGVTSPRNYGYPPAPVNASADREGVI